MQDLTNAIEEAIDATDRLSRFLRKGNANQVRSSDEKGSVKATCYAWFQNQRTRLTALGQEPLLESIDASFRQLLELSEKSTTRSKYLAQLKLVKGNLVKLRSQAVKLITSGHLQSTGNEQPPDFAKLIPDPEMQAILRRRWKETLICREHGADLAAIVLMGSLLEALLLARANRLGDFSKLFKAAAAPKDRKSGDPKPLKEWTLRNYIDVAHELGWITKSAKDVGEVLRDYRNYIHPEKELKHGVELGRKDADMFWAVFQTIVEQVIDSV